MSNYTKSTNFTAKDSLPTGDTNKVVRGSEFDTEFNALSTAVATKADLAGPTFTGTATFANVTATGTVNFNGATISNLGTITTANLDGGTVDGAVIGGASAAAGSFTTLSASSTFSLGGVAVTSTAAELNILDGVTSTAAELNILDGVTSTAAELNILDGVTSTAAELNILDGVTSTAAELNILDGVTSTTAELNILDGVTATASELNILSGKAFVDEDDLSSNSATGIPSQQSVKAYVDSQTGLGGATLAGLADTTVTSPADAALLFYDTGTSKWIDNVVSGDVTIADTGVATIGTLSSLDVDNIQLDANAVKSTNTNGNIQLFPNGTGFTELYGNTNAGAIRFNCESNSHGVTIKGPPHSATATYELELPNADGTNGQFLKTNGSGKLSFGTVDVSTKVDENHTGDVNITGELLVDSYNETFKKVSSTGSSIAFTLSSAAYDNKSFSIASQGTGVRGLAFKSDGTKMFVTATDSSAAIYQYSLSTAWDASTASYDSVSLATSSQDTAPTDVNFKSDGTVMYVVGDNNNTIYQYTLSTAWDLSTASYASISFSLASQETQPEGVVFKTDGTKMFIIGGTEYVHEYALSTAWNVSTASYTAEKAVSEENITASGLDISSDGTTMFITGFGQDKIFKYTLSTAWDITSASYDSESFSVASQEDTPYGLRTGNNGTKTYIVGSSNNTVYQYSTATTTQSATFDCENANVFETVLSGNTTVAFSNPPAAGTATDSTAYAMSLKVVQDASASGYTVTWPASVDWPAATAPTLTATANAVDQFVFYTYTGGTTWYGFTAGQALG